MSDKKISDAQQRYMKDNLLVFLGASRSVFEIAGSKDNLEILDKFFDNHKEYSIDFLSDLRKIYRKAIYIAHPDKNISSDENTKNKLEELSKILNTKFNECMISTDDVSELSFENWFSTNKEFENEFNQFDSSVQDENLDGEFAIFSEWKRRFTWCDELSKVVSNNKNLNLKDFIFILSYENKNFSIQGWGESEYKSFIEKYSLDYENFISKYQIDDSEFSYKNKFKAFANFSSKLLEALQNKFENQNSSFGFSTRSNRTHSSDLVKEKSYYDNLYVKQPSSEYAHGSDFIYVDWLNQNSKDFNADILNKVSYCVKNFSEVEIKNIVSEKGLLVHANMVHFDIERTDKILESLLVSHMFNQGDEHKIKFKVHSSIAQNIKNGGFRNLHIGNVDSVAEFLHRNRIDFVPETSNAIMNTDEKNREIFLYQMLQLTLTLKNYLIDIEKNHDKIKSLCSLVGSEIPKIPNEFRVIVNIFEDNLKQKSGRFYNEFHNSLNTGIDLIVNKDKLVSIAKIILNNPNVSNIFQETISGRLSVEDSVAKLERNEKFSSELISLLKTRESFQNVVIAGLENKDTTLSFQSQNGLSFMTSSAMMTKNLFDFIDEHKDKNFISGISYNLMECMDKIKYGELKKRDAYLFSRIESNVGVNDVFSKNYIQHLTKKDGLLYFVVSTNYDQNIQTRINLAKDFVDFREVYGMIGKMNIHEYIREHQQEIRNGTTLKNAMSSLIFESFMQGQTNIFFAALDSYKKTHSKFDGDNMYVDSIKVKDVTLSSLIFFAGFVGNEQTKANIMNMREQIIERGFGELLGTPFSHSGITVKEAESPNFKLFVENALRNSPVLASIKESGFEISKLASPLSNMVSSFVERNSRSMSEKLETILPKRDNSKSGFNM